VVLARIYWKISLFLVRRWPYEAKDPPCTEGQCGALGANNDLLSDPKEKSPHQKTSTSSRKGDPQAGRLGKNGRGDVQPDGAAHALLPAFDGK